MTAILSRRFIFTVILAIATLGFFAHNSFAQRADTSTSQGPQRPVLQRIQEKRSSAVEQNKTKREEFNQKVKEITDEEKRAAVERINAAITSINEKKTTQWAQALDKLSEILERLKTKVVELESQGTDVAEINELITSAQTSIDTAITAVEEQAAKEYTIEIEDEATLGATIRPVVQSFKQDLRATLAEVQDAKKAIQQIVRAINSLANPQDEPTE